MRISQLTYRRTIQCVYEPVAPKAYRAAMGIINIVDHLPSYLLLREYTPNKP